MTSRISFGAITGRFLATAFGRPTTWLIFVVAPIVLIIALVLAAGVSGIGLLVFSMTMQAGIVSTFALRDKESGVYRRILVAPIGVTSYSFALFTAVYAIVLIEALVVIGVTSAALALAPALLGSAASGVRIDAGAALIVSLLYAAPASSFGLLLTSVASGETQGAVLTNIAVIFTSFLGGCFWPVSIMPETMQRVSRLLPQTWANLAYEALTTASGPTIESAPGAGAILLLFAVVLLLLAALGRRRVPGSVYPTAN